MFNSLKIVLATILSVFLTGQAYANTEERILKYSTSDEGWKAFSENLGKVTMGEVKGYDSATDTVYTGAILVWVCQNQAPAWKQACQNKVERYEALKARNGWGDTITGADLRAQGQGQGIFFPFGSAPVAAASAPAVAAASAPTSAPSNADAAIANLAAAVERLKGQVAKVPEGTVTKAELDARLKAQADGLTKTTDSVVAMMAKRMTEEAARTAKTEREFQALRRQMADAFTKAQSNGAALREEFTTAFAGIDALRKQVDGAAGTAGEAREIAQLAKADVTSVKEGLTVTRLVAIAALVVALLVIGFVVKSRGQQKALVAKQIDNTVDALFESHGVLVDNKLEEFRKAVAGNTQAMAVVTDHQRQLGQRVNQVIEGMNSLNERLVTTEVMLGIDQAWHLSADERANIKVATETLEAGKTSSGVKLDLPGNKSILLTFEGIDEKSVYVNGIANQRRPVKKTNLYATIRGAYLRQELTGISVPSLQPLHLAA